MNQYALYLRKSRADLDAEARGEGETLAKHRAALTALAKQRGLLVVREYAEIVSGDTIAARPQMQQLLDDVKAGLYAGVIVNDVDRLGRGDSIDQEIIKYTFAASRTLIITPNRDIDPANPTDQDTLDFSMFLARFEYRKIAQRLREGKARSAAQGNWAVGVAPYGYARQYADGRFFLVPDPVEAPIVRMVFSMAVNDGLGPTAISYRLSDMGIKSRHNCTFDKQVIRRMLSNKAYIGCVVYGSTRTAKNVDQSGRRSVRLIKSDPMVIHDAHEPLVPVDVFEQAQKRFSSAPINTGHTMRNPLSGLVYCVHCGKVMKLHHSTHGYLFLKCWTPGCKTHAKRLSDVEDAIIDTLRGWCADYAAPDHHQTPIIDRRQPLLKQLEQIDGQYKRAQELVEMGVYTLPEFIRRRDDLMAQRSAVEASLDELARPSKRDMIITAVPVIEKALDAYAFADTPEQKNKLLKTMVSKIVYTHDDRDTPVQLDIMPVFLPVVLP